MKAKLEVGLALLLVAMAGCVNVHQGAVSTTSIGPNEIPVRVVTGRSSGIYVLGMGPLADGTLKAAVDDARKKAPSDSIVNVFADTKRTCFPFFPFCLIMGIETTVHGTLIRYRQPLNQGVGTPEVVDAVRQTLTATDASSAYEKLVMAYAQDQETAEDFLSDLSPDLWKGLKNYVITQKGNGSGWNWKLRSDASMSQRERSMLEWYVSKYTDYKPLFEK